MNLRTLAAARKSIAGRLMIWFLLIALIPCGLLTAAIGYIAKRSLEATVRQRLVALADVRATQLESYIRERKGDSIILGRAPGIVALVKKLNGLIGSTPDRSPEFRREAEALRPNLSFFVDVYGYSNIYIFNFDGVPLLSQKAGLDSGENILTGPQKGTEFAEAFTRARTLFQPVVSDYQLYPGRDQPTAFLAGPILDNGRAVGIAIFEFGNREVFKVFYEYGGLGETGETQVAMLKDKQLTYIGPVRGDATAKTFRTGPTLGSQLGIPMQQGVQGKRGYGRTIDYRGRDVAAAWSYLPSYRWGLVVKQDAAEAFGLISELRRVMGALLAATLLIVVVAALLVARSLSRPVREASRVAQLVASGDLTARSDVKAGGETGQLLAAIGTMTEDLRSVIGRIQKSSVGLMSTATEIAATSRQQERVVQDYGASTSESVAAVKEISATSQELLKTMDDVSQVAAQTAELASAGQGSLAGMDRTMRLLADATASIGSKLAVINERAANINLVVTTITKVADQTNLLSINAAIEAEKAGEYGLGFLVVSREIRRLADQTAVATLDIERMVKEMQYSVSAGVMEMDKFSDQVRQGVGEVGHISEQLGRIIGEVQALTTRFDQVNDGMRAQSQGADQIREAMVRLGDGSHQIAVSLGEFHRAAEHLHEAVAGLKEEVSRFVLGDDLPRDIVRVDPDGNGAPTGGRRPSLTA